VNEGILKSPDEAALDDVTAHVNELLEVCRSLEGTSVAETLLARLQAPRLTLESALEALISRRQARGDLPAVGNVELAQFGALAWKLEALLSEATAEELLAERLAQRCSDLLDDIAQSRAASRHEGLSDELDRLAAAVLAFRERL